MTPEERDQWRQFALNELLLDSGNRAAAATVVILDTIAALQRENARLREAVVFARQHIQAGDALHSCGMDDEDGSYNDGCGPEACWACLTNVALHRIDALTPSAAPGEGETR